MSMWGRVSKCSTLWQSPKSQPGVALNRSIGCRKSSGDCTKWDVDIDCKRLYCWLAMLTFVSLNIVHIQRSCSSSFCEVKSNKRSLEKTKCKPSRLSAMKSKWNGVHTKWMPGHVCTCTCIMTVPCCKQQPSVCVNVFILENNVFEPNSSCLRLSTTRQSSLSEKERERVKLL